MSRPKKWLIRAAAALALIVAADFAASFLVQSGRVHRALVARLQAAFGRPVAVGHFSFSLWGGPRIEADSLTVGEDPRFGQEYFLRAQTVEAALRWQSLARGRIEFGTFSLSQPSLNVVASGGRWNLADWLPPASAAGGRSQTPRLYRIEIEGGRINFKRGDDKLPFALVDVRGSVDERAPGRWQIALEAQPTRVAVILQDAGSLRVTGEVGGTSARLRPASVDLSWEDASLGDVLRLASGYDYGIRGRQDLDLRANSTGDLWRFELSSRASDLHRWDMVAQPGDPAVNIRLAGSWQPGAGKLRITGGRIEGPASLVGVSGEADWPVSDDSSLPLPRPRLIVQFDTAGVGAQDLLACYRAFRPGVSPALHASGWLQGSLDLAGWPPQISQATLDAAGLRVEGGALQAPIRVASANVQASAHVATGSIARIDFGPQVGDFRVSGDARYDGRWNFSLQAAGSTPHLAGLVAAVEALGTRPPRYWSEFGGQSEIQLNWSGNFSPFKRNLIASLDLHNAVWREPSLPAQVHLDDAHVTAYPGGLRIAVRQAEALGTRWSGWLDHRQPGGTWQFDLRADRLDVAALVARLRPQPRHTSLLERIFGPGRGDRSRPSWLTSLDASGRFAVNRIQVDPLWLDQVQGSLAILNGSLDLGPAQARFAGGDARGSFVFSIAKRVPVWHLTAKLANSDLAQVSKALEGSAGRFSGLASGTVDVGARGATAVALVGSLSGKALMTVRSARDQRIDWLATLQDGRAVAGRSNFQTVTARIRLDGGKLDFEDLNLVGDRGRVDATGGIDLARDATLAVEARFSPFSGRFSRDPALDGRTFQVTGSSAHPHVGLVPAADTPAAGERRPAPAPPPG